MTFAYFQMGDTSYMDSPGVNVIFVLTRGLWLNLHISAPSWIVLFCKTVIALSKFAVVVRIENSEIV